MGKAEPQRRMVQERHRTWQGAKLLASSRLQTVRWKPGEAVEPRNAVISER